MTSAVSWKWMSQKRPSSKTPQRRRESSVGSSTRGSGKASGKGVWAYQPIASMSQELRCSNLYIMYARMIV